MRRNRSQIYRILKNLEQNNMIEKTLESPTHFSPTPLETILDLNIREKRTQSFLLEQAKKEILNHWQNIPKKRIATSTEKFNVIEGKTRIYPKILQTIENARKELLIFINHYGFSPPFQLEIEEAILKKSQKNLRTWILTQKPEKTYQPMIKRFKIISKEKPHIIKCRLNSEVNLHTLFIVMDEEEAIPFTRITEFPYSYRNMKDDVCVWTDSKVVINILKTLFNQLWKNSKSTSSISSQLKKRDYSEKAIQEVSKWYIHEKPEGTNLDLVL